MSLVISAAPWDKTPPTKHNNTLTDVTTNKNTTRRKQTLPICSSSSLASRKTTQRNHSSSTGNKVEDFLKGMHMNTNSTTNNDDDDDETEGFVDYTPPPPLPKLNSQQDHPPLVLPQNDHSTQPTPSSKISAASKLGAQSNYHKSYQIPSKMVPYVDTTTGGVSISSNSQYEKLMEKMNYIIHILEEQQHERTENFTEEITIFAFLGIFIIFVCDCFARSGKKR